MKGYVLTFDGKSGPDVFAACEQLGFWPAGATWWFGWNELEIRLPAPLEEPASALDARWTVVRIFSGAAELRRERQGRGLALRLLLEDEARQKLPEDLTPAKEASFSSVEQGYRLLVGGCLLLPTGSVRGRVDLPRPLDYGVGSENLDCSLAARVYLYRAEDGVVRLVRYADLITVAEESRRHHPWRVRPFGDYAAGMPAEGE